MGTLYYMRIDPCPHCGRVDKQWLICKSHRLFRAYGSPKTEYVYDTPADNGRPVKSWQDWVMLLTKPQHEVWDEYGAKVDIDSFIQKVQEVPMNQRRRNYDAVQELVRERGYRPIIGEDWLDPEGYSFYNEDFS